MSESVSFRSSISGFNRGEVLAYIKNVLEEKAELSAQLEEATKRLEAIEKEKAELSEKLEELSRRTDPEEVEKMNAQQLGKIMFDARRYSDLIIYEAKAAANEMMNDASRTSEGLYDTVRDLADRAKTSGNTLSEALASVLSEIELLGTRLESFSQDVKEEDELFRAEYSSENHEEAKQQ